ncbi:MAG: NAD(P)/FAD-dependent oxidoreductase [archaeon]|nr:MAG: NAD(P)/FAD-dependent oxidoreductase [archaeon]
MIKMDNEYDVIVVGAGPAGSAVAEKCALGGLKVLLLEKRQEIGSPKRCAEGISVSTEKMFGDLPEKCVAKRINGCIIYAPNKKNVVIEYGEHGGYVVERKILDKWLATRASIAGAHVRAKTEVTDVIKEQGFVKGVKAESGGERFEIRTKLLVAADGMESFVARKAGMETTNQLVNVDSGFQYEMASLKLKDPDKIEIFMGSEVAPRGYVWIFPKGNNTANVGIGIAMAEKPAKNYLDKFIEDNPDIFGDAGILEVNSGGIPVGGFLKNMVDNGLVVVGDAAHQVNPIHGGGLKEASMAGKIAGEIIIRAVKNGDVSKKALSEYNQVWWKERGHALERVQKLREVVEKLNDDELNMLAENLSGKEIIEFTRGKKLLNLGKLLIKKPRLMKLAKKLF